MYAKLSTALLETGFVQSSSDHTLFIKTKGTSFLAVLVYVDDILIASNNDYQVLLFKKFLFSTFKLKDLGPFKYFLGIEVAFVLAKELQYVKDIALDLLQETGTLDLNQGQLPWNLDLSSTMKMEIYFQILLHTASSLAR